MNFERAQPIVIPCKPRGGESTSNRKR